MRGTNTFLFMVLLLSTAAWGQGQAHSPRGYFISIDGLQPALVDALAAQDVLVEPHGLGWLKYNSMVVDRVRPVASLTAASHISTVTCSPPSRHGVIANNYLEHGKKVSGYAQPFTSEPLWSAAMRQGKKVMTLAYVGADGSSPERTADYTLAYPDDSLLAPGQILTLKLADLPPAVGWNAGQPTASFKEAVVKITLNPKTKESRDVQVLIGAGADGKPMVWLDDDKDLSNGLLGKLGGDLSLQTIVDAYYREADAASTMVGSKRRTFFRLLPQADNATVSLYVSKASYNNAYPASFREELDRQNLVWPDYGIHAPDLSVDEVVTGQLMIDTFLTDVAVQFTDRLNIDILLFYNPILDTLGHSYQARLPDLINAAATDEITQAFVRGFKAVDKNVSRVLAGLGPQDVVALMGDHGMEPIEKTVNLAALLSAEQINQIDVITSGGLTLVYPKQSGDETAEARMVAADLVGKYLADRLGMMIRDGRRVCGKTYRLADYPFVHFPFDYTNEWQFGEAAWALTSGARVWFTFNPLSHDIFGEPPALGMHGHDPSLPSQATKVFMVVPGFGPASIVSGNLIDVVPTFTKFLGMAPPANCLGSPLF